MNRRKFLQALFAVPVIAAPLLVPTQPESFGPIGTVTVVTGTWMLDAPYTQPSIRWTVTKVDREQGIITLSGLPTS